MENIKFLKKLFNINIDGTHKSVPLFFWKKFGKCIDRVPKETIILIVGRQTCRVLEKR